jgi:LysM repeat protein
MTATTCGAPANWGNYIVKPGDTLYGLSLRFGATVSALQRANCLGESTLLKVGQKLRVPPGPSVPPTVPVPTSIPSSPTQTPFTPLPTSLP